MKTAFWKADWFLGLVLAVALLGFARTSGFVPALERWAYDLNNPHPPIRGVDPSLPTGVEAVIHKALAKDFEKRFQAGSEFAEAIRQGRRRGASAPSADARA